MADVYYTDLVKRADETIRNLDQAIEKIRERQREIRALRPKLRQHEKDCDEFTWGRGKYRDTNPDKELASASFIQRDEVITSRLRELDVLGKYDNITI